jgi:DNA recombination protein Rad52
MLRAGKSSTSQMKYSGERSSVLLLSPHNHVVRFNGWSSSVVNLTTDFIDSSEESKRYSVGVTALVRVTLRDGVFHEDVGYGMLENSKSKGAALDKVCIISDLPHFYVFPHLLISSARKKQ